MDSIQKVCLVYQSMGLGFVTRDSSPRKIRLATTWFLLQMAIIVTNVALMLKFHRLIYYYHDAMGAFNDLIKYIATVCATILIIVESYRKRHKLAQIEELAGAFQQEMVVFLRRKELVKSNRKFWHNYKIKFFAFTIYYVLSEAILIPVYLLSRNYSKSIAYVFSNNVMIGICRYRHLQHVLYMDLVDYELRLLVHILRSGKVSEQKLGRLQELYGNTGQKVKLLNNFFSSQSMNIIFNHLQLLGDFYWIYWRHLNGCCSVGFYSKMGQFIAGDNVSIIFNYFLGILVTMSHTTWLMYLIFSTSVSCSNTVS